MLEKGQKDIPGIVVIYGGVVMPGVRQEIKSHPAYMIFLGERRQDKKGETETPMRRIIDTCGRMGRLICTTVVDRTGYRRRGAGGRMSDVLGVYRGTTKSKRRRRRKKEVDEMI